MLDWSRDLVREGTPIEQKQVWNVTQREKADREKRCCVQVQIADKTHTTE